MRALIVASSFLAACSSAAPIPVAPAPRVLDPQDPGSMFDPPPPAEMTPPAPSLPPPAQETERPRLVALPIVLATLPIALESDAQRVPISMRRLGDVEHTGISAQAVLENKTLGFLQLGPWIGWNGGASPDVAAPVSCTEGVRSTFDAHWATVEPDGRAIRLRFGDGVFEEATCSVRLVRRGDARPDAIVPSIDLHAFRDGGGQRLVFVLPRSRFLGTDHAIGWNGSFTLIALPLTKRENAAFRAEVESGAVKTMRLALGSKDPVIAPPVTTIEVEVMQGALDGKPLVTLYTDAPLPSRE